MNKKLLLLAISALISGAWSFGLGLRWFLALYFTDFVIPGYSGTWIAIPQSNLNLYFDLLPLAIFGLISVCLSVYYLACSLFATFKRVVMEVL